MTEGKIPRELGFIVALADKPWDSEALGLGRLKTAV